MLKQLTSCCRYIQYCKANCHPRLSDAAASMLKESYVKIRQVIISTGSPRRLSRIKLPKTFQCNLDYENVVHRSVIFVPYLLQDMRRQSNETGEAAAIPITVRQLEAIVRLSEALARMRL